ncbi:hypothetical protein GCM10010176_095300 [Nonomuraea spiralis]|nr:hypothetical protein GCM10010176_095300 [Nonomuraea spiralis]
MGRAGSRAAGKAESRAAAPGAAPGVDAAAAAEPAGRGDHPVVAAAGGPAAARATREAVVAALALVVGVDIARLLSPCLPVNPLVCNARLCGRPQRIFAKFGAKAY